MTPTLIFVIAILLFRYVFIPFTTHSRWLLVEAALFIGLAASAAAEGLWVFVVCAFALAGADLYFWDIQRERDHV